MRYLLFLSVLSFAFASCKQTEYSNDKGLVSDNNSTQKELSTIEKSQKAHGLEFFKSQEYVSFDIYLNFGGNTRLDGTITMSTDSENVLIQKNNGEPVLYSDNKIWFSGNAEQDQNARFDALTWSYFFALPFKMNDEGTYLKKLQGDEKYTVLELTFGKDVGDSPDDWYHLYINKQNQLLDYAGYIVTFGGKDANEATKDAHAIRYDKYQNIQGVQLATSWQFYSYQNAVPEGEIIGYAEISNIEFGTISEPLFERPKGAHQISMD